MGADSAARDTLLGAGGVKVSSAPGSKRVGGTLSASAAPSKNGLHPDAGRKW